MRPLTGITCNYDPKDEIGTISHMGQPEQQWLFLAEDYIASVEMAGGMPVILPVCRHLDTILEMSESLDGMLCCRHPVASGDDGRLRRTAKNISGVYQCL